MSQVISIPWTGGKLTLRPEASDDLIFRFELFCQSRTPEWYRVSMPDTLRSQIMHHQFDAQTTSYSASYPRARFDIIELDGRRIGRIVIDREPARLHLVDQAIIPELRNRGLGTAIMNWLIAESTRDGLPITLYVANSNDPSMRLYARLGFEKVEETALYLKMNRPPDAPGQAA
jgi:ribosomal protein S18 acetylase RimI-like enzyme